MGAWNSVPDDVDVVVVGGGINGLAITRELSHLGISVALFDREDIGSATTAISTRLIHGGLKYLERGELNLVRECIREQKILFRTAPHLIETYPMLIPFAKENSRHPFILLAGLLLQDLISPFKAVPRSFPVFPQLMKKKWAGLFQAGIRWGAVYHDARVPLTERLCSEIAQDAIAHGAWVSTYSPVIGIDRDSAGVQAVHFETPGATERKTVKTKAIINASGPWVDQFLKLVDFDTPLIGPTRGTHVMVEVFPGAPDTCVFFEASADQRPMFILPWEGIFMIGTTDVRVDETPERIVGEFDEVQYLLTAVNTLIPQAKLSPEQVLWTYSGLRPLPSSSPESDPSTVSRDFSLHTHDDSLTGLFSLVGGKWTTHRALGEFVGKRVLKFLGKTWPGSPTRNALLPGAHTESLDQLDATPWLTAESRERLTRVYGSAASKLVRLAEVHPEYRRTVGSGGVELLVEAVWALQEEGATTLGDIVLRRMAAFINQDAGLEIAESVARELVNLGEWSAEEGDRQWAEYRTWITRYTPASSSRGW